MREYGAYWAAARRRRGWTQRELSRHLRLTTAQFVSNVERGIARYSLEHVRVLIRELRLDRNEVLDLIMRIEESRLRRALGKKKLWV